MEGNIPFKTVLATTPRNVINLDRNVTEQVVYPTKSKKKNRKFSN